MRKLLLSGLIWSLGLSGALAADRLDLRHADAIELILGSTQDTTMVKGSVVFATTSGLIECDSALWIKGIEARLIGSVRFDDGSYRIVADTVIYDLTSRELFASGTRVELWSRTDSLFAVGSNALIDRDAGTFVMTERPTVFIGYPDSTTMVEVTGETIHYTEGESRAEAQGAVVITGRDYEATAGCAVMSRERQTLDLFDNPVAKRGNSRISGSLLSIVSDGSRLKSIDVVDSASAVLVEEADSGAVPIQSELSAERILFTFEAGELRSVISTGEAYGLYLPAPGERYLLEENLVSGDSILFLLEQEELRQVEVHGGAVGQYRYQERLKSAVDDSGSGERIVAPPVDTVDYSAQHLYYGVSDSLIRLVQQSSVSSGPMALTAHRIDFFTGRQIVEAFSADTSRTVDSRAHEKRDRLQPNAIPVTLKDGNESLEGDYLEYSMATRKGRIVQSKSAYQTGYFYGDDLYREQDNIFYLHDGEFTTCDAEEPHFHFSSKELKLIEGDRLIAKPVTLSIGRLPILAIPYYIFPLKKGRHSGFLTFNLGNIERGDRYVRNLGYYWAPSDFWDVQTALDYYERQRSVNLYGKFTYRRLYHYDGQVSGNYTRATSYSSSIGDEFRQNRWTFTFSHNQEIDPSLKITSSGSFQSDATFYNDFSTNLSDRLNRTLRSSVNIQKRFSRTVSLSANLTQEENLDANTRTSTLPSLSLSLPPVKPFGSGRKLADGRLQQSWYHQISLTYRPSLVHRSSRSELTSVDTATADTTRNRTRKRVLQTDHAISSSASYTVLKYLLFKPSLGYNEGWTRVFTTDQSQRAGIESDWYRTYIYSGAVELQTTLYGTVYPNRFGLLGLRHTVTPSVSFRFTPEINKFPEVRTYSGGGFGSTRQSRQIGLSLVQVIQAKVQSGENDRSLNILSINSSTSYDLEAADQRWSSLSTSINSTAIPKLSLNATLLHSFYVPGTNRLRFWSPYLTSLQVSANTTLAGDRFIFDDAGIARPVDTTSSPDQGPSGTGSATSGAASGGGWSLDLGYSYSESGRDLSFRKQSFLRLSLGFSLSQTTTVAYSQYYDIARKLTINNEVQISKRIHCWTGNIYWVPIGSNRGFGFRLFVTALPAIKLDNSRNSLSSGYFQSLR